MKSHTYKHRFRDRVVPQAIEETFLLAIAAVEYLHGKPKVRKNARYCLRAHDRTCVIDASSDVGRDIMKLFSGFATRELGPGAFGVQQITDTPDLVKEASQC